MQKSLKLYLLNFIRLKGEVPIEEIYKLALEYGAKVSNAERRMRELCVSENIHPLTKKSKRNTDYIYAYRAGEKPIEQKPKIVFEGNKAVMIYQ